MQCKRKKKNNIKKKIRAGNLQTQPPETGGHGCHMRNQKLFMTQFVVLNMNYCSCERGEPKWTKKKALRVGRNKNQEKQSQGKHEYVLAHKFSDEEKTNFAKRKLNMAKFDIWQISRCCCSCSYRSISILYSFVQANNWNISGGKHANFHFNLQPNKDSTKLCGYSQQDNAGEWPKWYYLIRCHSIRTVFEPSWNRKPSRILHLLTFHFISHSLLCVSSAGPISHIFTTWARHLI